MHHAYLLLGRPEDAEAHFTSVLAEWGVSRAQNPDVLVMRFETFGIDEARDLTSFASRVALGERKAFLLVPERITVEAQNALLKTFEDPVQNTHFFLTVREAELLIPTLRSRMQTVRLASGVGSDSGVQGFVSSSLTERLKFAKNVGESDESLHLPTFLDSLLLYYREKGLSTDVRKVYNMRRFANDRAVSPRIICEHLSLVLSQ